MEYNTQRPKLKINEYGRNIYKLIQYAKGIEDREKRNRMVQTLVNVMSRSEDGKSSDEDKRRYWVHLMILADWDLDVDVPYDITPEDSVDFAPRRLSYGQDGSRFHHYGHVMEAMVKRAAEYPDGEERDALIARLAHAMKRDYLLWNRDTVENDSLLWVFPSPQADFIWSPDHLSIHNPHAQFYNQTLPDTCTYLWLFPHDTSASSSDTSFEVDPFDQWEINTEPGDYPVSLIAYLLHYGPDTLTIVCTDTAIIPIYIANTYLQFPNLVTPNGDGVNDIWKVVNLLEMGEYSMNELWIYDRWGVLVYHVKDIYRESDFWNPEDTNSPDGTYYFRFMAKNNFGVVKRNGVIEVVR